MSKADAKKFIDLLHTDAGTRKAVHDAAEKILNRQVQGIKISRAELSDALKEHWVKREGKDRQAPDLRG